MVPSFQPYLLKFHRTASMYCHQAITSDILTSTHANYVVLKQHTCMPVAEKQDLQECVFVTSRQQWCMLQLHPTNRNAGYSCIGSVCKSVILVPDQQPSHYCHRVSRHLYLFHVWLSTHVWNQDSRPAVIYVTASRNYQACCSTHVFKLCSETAGMFVTVAPGYLAHRMQACISVWFANTFVVVELCQQVSPLHLPQTHSYVFYACTRPMGC